MPISLRQAAQTTWDVVVVGGGVAGSMAARSLALGGSSVLLVDKAAFPRWKVCGCCLNPIASSLLVRVGLGDLLARCGAMPVHSLRLGMRNQQAEIDLPGWQVLSRERLDAALVEAAVAAGVTFLSETVASLGPIAADRRLVNLRRHDETVGIAAELVLAADGLGNQLVRGEAGEEVRGVSARIGAGVIVEHGATAYEAGVIHMACGPEGYVGAVRLEDGRLNLAAALSAQGLRAAGHPGIMAAHLLQDAGWPVIANLSSLPWRGTPAMHRQRRRPAGQRLLVLGDAASYLEPFTGEGMSWALSAGVAAAALVRRGALAWHPRLTDRWAARQRHAANVQQRFCRAVTWVSHHPSVARVLIGIFKHFPALAAPLTRFNVRDGQ